MLPQRTTAMKFDPDAIPASRRRHGRVRCDQTRCTLGTVLDMSASGMRVLIRGRPRLHVGEVSPLLVEIDGGALALQARCVWLNRVSWRRYVAGIQFVDLSPEVQRVFREVAASASNNEYIREGLSPEARSA